jgi:putative phosphoribosyl transferase
MQFQDRRDAGRRLAQQIIPMGISQPVVIGLPRGGVPVAFEIARAMRAQLDILIARKIGAPENPEYGIGAIAEGYSGLINTGELNRLGISFEQLEAIVSRERAELERRRIRFREQFPQIDVTGRPTILVDDGLATGVTATAAARALRQREAQQILLAIPVGAPSTIRAISREVEQVISLAAPEQFQAVGSWYIDFTPTTDHEVLELLAEARAGWSKGA